VVEEAHQTAKDILNERRDELESLTQILLDRETIDAKEFVALLEGKPADEVVVDEEEPPSAPAEPAREPEKAAREGARPNPRPRPGFAGGDAS
jgi:cell division protease FtsH